MRDILGALLNGATLVIPRHDDILPGNVFDTFRKHHISYSVVTPSVLKVSHLEDLPELKKIAVAGEAVDHDVIQTWGAGRKLFNAYGLTESTVCCAVKVYENGKIEPDSPVTIGKPTQNMGLYILTDDLKPVIPGETGEIFIGGLGVSRRGYLHHPDLNQTKFIQNPYGEGILLKSGDLGRLTPKGEIEFLGRKDFQIRINGKRIEAGEIESRIKQHPAVRDCVVKDCGDLGTRYLVGYLLKKEGSYPETQLRNALLKSLGQVLPAYMVPHYFVILEDWPKTVNNKIDIKGLPLPAVTDMAVSEIIPPTNAIESGLVEIWQKILRMEDANRIGVTNRFEDLGGSSLTVALMLREVEKRFGKTISPGDFYQADTTIQKLALLVKGDFASSALLDYDFAQEVQLPSDIVPAKTKSDGLEHHIFLTGATGFLGSQLLMALLKRTTADIHCLVRARDSESGMARIRHKLESFGQWEDRFQERIHIVPGNLSEKFGLPEAEYTALAQQIDSSYHCAAEVNFLKPYAALKQGNVEGTIEMLRFSAAEKAKPIHAISTLAVFTNRHQTGAANELPVSHLSTGILGGYAQSKWVAEQVLLKGQKRGLDVTIFRPAHITGDMNSGISPTEDFNFIFLKGIIQTGKAPDLDFYLEFTPVDYVCNAILNAAETGQQNTIQHLVNPVRMPLKEIIAKLNQMGYKISTVPYADWKQGLKSIDDSSALVPVMSVFLNPIDGTKSYFDHLITIDCVRKNEFETAHLAESMANNPIAAYDTMFPKYIQALVNTGFLPEPSQKEKTGIS